MPAKNPKLYAHTHYEQNKDIYKARCQDRRKRARIWLCELKKTLQCSRCGNTDYRVLQFHHLNDKSFEVWKGISGGYSIEKLKQEIKKCEVLCANCHAIEHHVERTI